METPGERGGGKGCWNSQGCKSGVPREGGEREDFGAGAAKDRKVKNWDVGEHTSEACKEGGVAFSY